MYMQSNIANSDEFSRMMKDRGIVEINIVHSSEIFYDAKNCTNKIEF
jgi:hypothetical protein